MKKIMFNYGLMKAVLVGRKTQTRRIVPKSSDITFVERNEIESFIQLFSRYEEGEVVAVAQSYKDAGCDFYFHRGLAGWNNKMFVRSDEMPHRIRITNVRVERLQDISDEDCLKEGIYESPEAPYNTKKYGCFNSNINVCSPREAFAILIDKVSGKGTWDGNPWVFVYDFELIK